MELHVDREKSENSVVFLRWCLSLKEIKIVSENSALEETEPYILLCVIAVKNEGKDRHDFLEESRKALPLKDMATYLSMLSPGRHLIYAFVVESENKAKDFLAVHRRYDSYTQYRQDVFNFWSKLDSEDWIYDSNLRHNPYAAADIMVDERSFAKKPWDFQLVNSWCEYLPLDECGFKKRRWAVYPLIILCLPFRQFWGLVWILFYLALGLRNIGWKAYNPLSALPISELSPQEWSSVFLVNKAGHPQPWRTAFFPPLLIGAYVFFSLMGWSVAVSMAVAIITFIVVASLVFRLLVYLDARFESEEYKLKQARRAALKSAERDKRIEQRKAALKQELSVLSCRLVPQEIGLQTLPKERQTIRLRFLDLKRKVCKPYAR